MSDYGHVLITDTFGRFARLSPFCFQKRILRVLSATNVSMSDDDVSMIEPDTRVRAFARDIYEYAEGGSAPLRLRPAAL